MVKKEQSETPIFINLNGSFVIPVEHTAPISGSVSGDLRLAALDAFLHSLSGLVPETDELGAALLGKSIKTLADKCNAYTLLGSSVVIEITTHINKDKGSITHAFKLSLCPNS